MDKQIAWYVLGRLEGYAEAEVLTDKKKQIESICDFLRDALDEKTEHDGCHGCRHDHKEVGEEPCVRCRANYLDKFERA